MNVRRFLSSRLFATARRLRPRLRPYLESIGMVALVTLLGQPVHYFLNPTNLVMLYLLGIVLVARRSGQGPSTVAALRRTNPTTADTRFQSGELLVDFGLRLVRVAGQDVSLTPTEYDLLCELVAHAGKVLTHRHLLNKVWGAEYVNDTHILRVNISNLRHKLEPEPTRPRHILTEPGVGYRLKLDE